MLCGENKKTGRCMKVNDKKNISHNCEVNMNVSQKRCKRKTVKVNPKKNPKKTIKDKPKKKICPPGKILNVKTERCINEPNKDKPKKKICPPGKILNVKTNRCVINRKLDSDEVIDFKYKCKSDQIYNPESKRCIKKNSPLGKKLMITKITDKIGGPISLHYFKFKFAGVMRHFLLFGDEHTQYVEHKSPDTIEITTLIKKIIRKSPHCIDLFSENPIYHDRAKGKVLQKYSNPLSGIRNEFGQCPIHNLPGAKCNYDNLRYQNWDLRFSVRLGSGYKSNPYDEILMKYPKEYKDIINKFSKKNLIYYFLGFTNLIKTPTLKKIDNHFDKILSKKNNRDSFTKIVTDKQILQDRRNLIQKEYKKCMKSFKFPKDFLEVFIKSYINLNSGCFTLVFTDFYILCRMFLNFDINKKTPKRCPTKGGNNYKTPQYSILYAGDNHVRDIFSFFERMFDVKPVYTTALTYPNGKSNKVLSIKDFRDENGKILKDISSVDDLFKDFY